MATLILVGTLSVLATASGIGYALSSCRHLDVIVRDLDSDDANSSAMVRDMAAGLPSYDGSVLTGVINQLVRQGYDINGYIDHISETAPTPAIREDFRMAPTSAALADNVVAIQRPCRQSKFVLACVCELRAKIGVVEKNSANVLLVQSLYLKLCRDHRVRQTDVVLHRQYVINTFFRESFDDAPALARYNAPRWLVRLREWDKPVQRSPAVVGAF